MNPGTAIIVNLLGGVALLLWGVRMVRTGVTRGWGEQLRQFLQHRLGNRVTAFLAGAGATTILGSGTATGLIVSNIAAAGGLPLAIGIAVLLGADVGSAITTSVFASGVGIAKQMAPLLVFIGYVIFGFTREAKPHSVGRILIGIGLILIALQLISASTRPLNEATLFHDVLRALGEEPLLAFIIGAGLAWAFHSTLAAILLITSLTGNDSMGIESAAAFVLGINVGGCFPALIGSLALPVSAKRLPATNLFCRGITCIAALAALPWITELFTQAGTPGAAVPLLLHLGVNLVVGLIWLPLTGIAAAVMTRLMPDAEGPVDRLASPRYLLPFSTTSSALANCVLEAGRMGEVLEQMFSTAIDAMRNNSSERLKELKRLDERLNVYHHDIQHYMLDAADSTADAEDERRILEIVLHASNLETAGDVVQLNLADRIKAKIKEAHAFTEAQNRAVDSLCLMIQVNMRSATAVLTSRDVASAQALIAQKDAFRSLENRIVREHLGAKKTERGKALRRSALFIDLIRDLHRINSHVVAVGYPIVDQAGLLRESRLRKPK